MSKRLIMALALVGLLSVGLRVSAQSSQPTFSVQTIAVKGMSAYDMKVSPDGKIAALYVGRNASALLNIKFSEYAPTTPVDRIMFATLMPIHLIDLSTGNMIGSIQYQARKSPEWLGQKMAMVWSSGLKMSIISVRYITPTSQLLPRC